MARNDDRAAHVSRVKFTEFHAHRQSFSACHLLIADSYVRAHNVINSPMRVLLTPHLANGNVRSGTIAAATSGKAAEEKSPGTVISSGRRRQAARAPPQRDPTFLRGDDRAHSHQQPFGVVACRPGW